MFLSYDRKVMRENVDFFLTESNIIGIPYVGMVKQQLCFPELLTDLIGIPCYSNGIVSGFTYLYDRDSIVVVDAFEVREGVPMFRAIPSDIAIVNFYCASNKLPTTSECHRIYEKLKEIGFKKVSFGGSRMLNIRCKCDEIRIGDALLTGFIGDPFSCYYGESRNPFTLKVPIEKYCFGDNSLIIRAGETDIGGFTDVKTTFVNTDFSGVTGHFQISEDAKFAVLKPDFHTLLKIATKRGSQYVDEIIG